MFTRLVLAMICVAMLTVLLGATGAQDAVVLEETTMAELDGTRMRAREMGIEVGILPTGKWNAITDVEGVRVGHVTLWEGSDVRTGVTSILPHGGDIYQQKVPGAVVLGNAYGKMAGSTQVQELGNIETPIVLTNTLSISAGLEGIIRYALTQPGNESLRSLNAVVGETNDSFLNDIRGLHVKPEHVIEAIKNAKSGAVEEGAIGAGTGTTCYGFKGGIGTSSRKTPKDRGGYTVGVLMQTNFGGILTINGAPVGRELGEFPYSEYTKDHSPDGSCMIIVATDAPLSSRNLERLGKRALLGLARTGSYISNGSGDYVIAFSTAYTIPNDSEITDPPVELVSNNALSPLFLACTEAAEEAVYNSMFMAKTVKGRDGNTREAIPLARVKEICKKYNVLHLQERLPGVNRTD